MVRTPLFAVAAIAAALFVAAPSEACEAHAKKKAETTASTPAPKKDAAPNVSVSDEIDAAMAGKCTCGSAADCTCKKNDCQCSKCNHKRKTTPLYESLKGNRAVPSLENARYDASAGVFI